MTAHATHPGATPIEVVEVDVSLPSSIDDLGSRLITSTAAEAQVLIRLCGEPLACVILATQALARDPGQVLTVAAEELAAASQRHGHPLLEAGPCRWRRDLDEVANRARPISVVICTYGRPERLSATLDSISRLTYPSFELVLVDNAPRDDRNAQVAASFIDRLNVHYVVEPVQGLARARNTGLHAAAHSLVAFTDDDVIVEPGWLLAIEKAFRMRPDVGVVSGPVLAAEIKTQAQALFEHQGGHSKGRGFRRTVFGYGPGEQHPMFPLPPFAVGANMAVDRDAVISAGAFDEGLGAGTEARAATTEMMLRGWKVVYEPAAMVWHFHRETMEDLRQQRFNYGVGLGAYYASLLRKDPGRIADLMRLSPAAIRAVYRPRHLGEGSPDADPDVSSVIERRALIAGLSAYARSRRAARRRPGQAAKIAR